MPSSACWLTGSRPENGSSRITSSGSWAIDESSCTFCAMPLESARIWRFAASPRPLSSSSVRARRRASAARHALQRGEEGDGAHRRHAPVEAALLGQEADPAAQLAPVGLAQHLQPAGGRGDEAEHHPQRRGLAGAVRAEEAEDGASLHLEREVAHGGESAVALGHPFQLERSVHGAGLRGKSLSGPKPGQLICAAASTERMARTMWPAWRSPSSEAWLAPRHVDDEALPRGVGRRGLDRRDAPRAGDRRRSAPRRSAARGRRRRRRAPGPRSHARRPPRRRPSDCARPRRTRGASRPWRAPAGRWRPRTGRPAAARRRLSRPRRRASKRW